MAETESVPEDGLLVWGNASVPYARAQYYGLPNKRWPGTYMQMVRPGEGGQHQQVDQDSRDQGGRRGEWKVTWIGPTWWSGCTGPSRRSCCPSPAGLRCE